MIRIIAAVALVLAYTFTAAHGLPVGDTVTACEDLTYSWDGHTLTPAPRTAPELPACE